MDVRQLLLVRVSPLRENVPRTVTPMKTVRATTTASSQRVALVLESVLHKQMFVLWSMTLFVAVMARPMAMLVNLPRLGRTNCMEDNVRLRFAAAMKLAALRSSATSQMAVMALVTVKIALQFARLLLILAVAVTGIHTGMHVRWLGKA